MRLIIAGSGDRPGKQEFLAYAEEYDQIIAADGACNWLLSYGVTPDVIVGDMDSVAPDVLQAMRKSTAKIVTAKREKDETDMMLAAMYGVKELHPEEAAIFGGLGGRLDHAYGNFQVLLYLLNNGIEATLIDDSVTIQLVRGRGIVSGDVGATVSILPFMGKCTVTGEAGAFQYPLDHLCLPEDFPIGLSNVLMKKNGVIQVEEGVAAVFTNRK